jgi:LDH2 family malate/lactate/ureidoglycolate dehydrogenase
MRRRNILKLIYNSLYDCAVEVLEACGEIKENAEIVAENLIKADARGINTHGTYLLTPIWERANAKQLSLPTNAYIAVDEGATAVIDGGDGLGAVAGILAVKTAVQKAKQYGVASVLIRNTNNIGALACYTEVAAKEGMIAIMSCNAAPAMAPWGGSEAFLGTNPFAIGIYTGHDMVFSADMASSVVARGKIRKAARNGETIPDYWATDDEGNFTTDPNAALKGALLPMSGPKGSAIALAVDIISGMLSGAQYAPNLKSFHTPEGATGVGASLIVIDISRFMDLKVFQEHMEGYIKSIKSMKKAKGFDEIFIPGEIEYKKEQDSYKYGIELDEKAVKAIDSICEAFRLKNRLGGQL